MAIDPSEWLAQADYDIDTAQDLLDKGRNFYAVFMCHLSVEKALKGLFWKMLDEIPPKTHDLIYLVKKIGIQPEEKLTQFLIELNGAHAATRYPEEFKQLHKEFPKSVVLEIMEKSREVIKWIKEQF
ncbi:MAG: HEPN domain-containing protein [Candidatus Marinimicrobia bacterium]|nr:HEPN domain-containing protein [Candidatus Neomarinimicrobiota bacterium]